MKTIDAKHYILDVTIDKSNLPKGYPFNLPIIQKLENIVMHPKVTFFVGENGAGKSTLLEAIAIASGFNPEGGSKNFDFYTKETHSQLSEFIKIHKGLTLPRDGFFLRAETFYNVATEIDNLNFASSLYGNKSLHHQSHGESFISLIENRFKGNGLYILDEPEAALSPANQFKFLVLMHKLVKNNSQFIITTHSPIIMGYPDADIFFIEDNSLKKSNYENTPHFQLTKYFLNNRNDVLKDLLGE